jgi:hypothetical protein
MIPQFPALPFSSPTKEKSKQFPLPFSLPSFPFPPLQYESQKQYFTRKDLEPTRLFRQTNMLKKIIINIISL